VLGLAACSRDAGNCPVVPNPSGDCESPADSDRPGYSSTEPCTYLRDCKLTLKREFWRAYVQSKDPSKAYILPRPDGSSCLPANKREMPAVNELTPAEALAATHCLHETLKFTVTSQQGSFEVAPGRMPDDVAVVCVQFPDLAASALKFSCSDCNVEAIVQAKKTYSCKTDYTPIPTKAEADLLADKLNFIYGSKTP
jgi:hypothetical protein